MFEKKNYKFFEWTVVVHKDTETHTDTHNTHTHNTQHTKFLNLIKFPLPISHHLCS